MRESTSNGNGWYNSEAEDDDQEQGQEDQEEQPQNGAHLSRASSTRSSGNKVNVMIMAHLFSTRNLRLGQVYTKDRHAIQPQLHLHSLTVSHNPHRQAQSVFFFGCHLSSPPNFFFLFHTTLFCSHSLSK